MSCSTGNGYLLVPIAASHDNPFEILLEPFSCSGLPFETFFSRSAVITICSKFLTSRSGPSVRNFTPAVQM